jgi:5-oxoprolinase (ATP-hydrolysing) subunit A
VGVSPLSLDLNCDAGENESPEIRRKMFRYVTSANIACGGHAGDYETMRDSLLLARRWSVKIGAHPGLLDRENFGRRACPLSAGEFELLLVHQIGALATLARSTGTRLHHIKLHGALYHMVEDQPELRKAYLKLVTALWPAMKIFAIAGGNVCSEARNYKVSVWPEAFLDRSYTAEGRLLPRSDANALLSLRQFRDRLRNIAKGGFSVHARTWCLHSDSPHAVEFARLAGPIFRKSETKRSNSTSKLPGTGRRNKEAG